MHPPVASRLRLLEGVVDRDGVAGRPLAMCPKAAREPVLEEGSAFLLVSAEAIGRGHQFWSFGGQQRC